MSGVKYTAFDIEKEQKERQEALRDLQREQAVIKGMAKRIQATLDSLPAGVRESFLSETSAAKKWLLHRQPTGSVNQSGSALRASVRECSKLSATGSGVLNALVNIAEHRRDEKAKELVEKVMALQVQLDGEKELFKKWYSDLFASYSVTCGALSGDIDKGEFVSVEQRITELRRNINQDAGKMAALENQDQERRYVQEALEEVCEEMGWKVVSSAELEKTGKPESDLLFKANTYTAGIMEFRLSLEGITVESPITHVGKTCHHDFGKVSEKLRAFGVNTSFEQLSPLVHDPVLKEKGALDLPDSGIAMEQQV